MESEKSFGSPEHSGDSDDERLSQQWLADIRQQPDFSVNDEHFVAWILNLPHGISMMASQQRKRETHSSRAGEDIITDQLRVLRKVFGR